MPIRDFEIRLKKYSKNSCYATSGFHLNSYTAMTLPLPTLNGRKKCKRLFGCDDGDFPAPRHTTEICNNFALNVRRWQIKRHALTNSRDPSRFIVFVTVKGELDIFNATNKTFANEIERVFRLT